MARDKSSIVEVRFLSGEEFNHCYVKVEYTDSAGLASTNVMWRHTPFPADMSISEFWNDFSIDYLTWGQGEPPK